MAWGERTVGPRPGSGCAPRGCGFRWGPGRECLFLASTAKGGKRPGGGWGQLNAPGGPWARVGATVPPVCLKRLPDP